MAEEISPAGLGALKLNDSLLLSGSTADLIGVTFGFTSNVGLDILTGLLDIPRNIERVARSLGDGQSVVESDAAGNGTETDDGTPHLIGGLGADSVAGCEAGCG